MKTEQTRIIQRRPALLIALLVCCMPGPIFAKQVSELDQIIAVVNNDVVTRTELDKRVTMVRQQLEKDKTRLPPDSILQKQVLERLILEMIQVQMAELRGIRISEEGINRVIENIAQENKLTMAQFRKVLARDGISFSEFRDNMKNQMLAEQLRKREIERAITVTPQEVSNYLAQAAKSGRGKNEYHLQHILIAVKEGASPEEIGVARDKAQDTLKKLRKGADFGQMAVSVSSGQNALKGGDLGWLKAGQLPTVFATTVLQMKPGETSDPIRSPSGFHIIHLRETRSKSKKHEVRQTLARHILIRTTQVVSDDDARRRLEKLHGRILAGEDFSKLAQLHSDDKASAVDGGSLGWLNPGSMFPNFEKVMNETKQGAVSKPFRTRFGWHILQVMSRRTHDNSLEAERFQAHQQIRQRKTAEAAENWLRRIRDEAYVEYRLNN